METTHQSGARGSAKFLRAALKRIRRLRRDLSRKVKGSHNRQKARLILAKAHVQMADQRLDHLHKLSTRLIRENQTVCIEDLNLSGMAKHQRLAHSIAEAGWRLLRTLLESRAAMYGRDVRVGSRWKPTSPTCSASGHEAGTLLGRGGQSCLT
ncbi:RNA-guided endonuclease InsQ/TnpB family protein [Candidatus Synechococcus spongiarum]|uniref:RNA-guided endonuclease InsQ/TnpB family protein n=1 Tax=Candidatus Synechococcus spongiarum TaxID=431041 RepID=UPI0034D553AF